MGMAPEQVVHFEREASAKVRGSTAQRERWPAAWWGDLSEVCNDEQGSVVDMEEGILGQGQECKQ